MELKNFDPNGVGVDNGAFFGLPFTPEQAALVLISAPWDVTVSYGAGAALAPDALIGARRSSTFTMPPRPVRGGPESPRPTSTRPSRSARRGCGPTPGR